MLSRLQEQDLVETGVIRNDRATPLASIELEVHRRIYQQTPALAIIHAHPPHAIALSMTESEVIPLDVEGSYLLQRVPIIGEERKSLGELAGMIAKALENHRIVMVKGHGSFAISQLLEEALHWTTALEESCQIICLLKTLKTAP